jgi:Cohesin domain
VNRSRLAALSAGAMFLVASVFVPATALAGGSGTLSLNPSSVGTSTGSTFPVDIVTNATVAVSGAQASIDFDKTKLQIVSVAPPTPGTGWNQGGSSYVLPSAATIATANSTGHLPAIGVSFLDGTSNLPAATNEILARVTFFATAVGSSTINLPTTGSDGGAIIDGTVGTTYGSPVATTATGATVSVTAGSGSTTSSITNITGTVDNGFVSLTCPTSVNIPLVRNVNNLADFECVVGSNVTWTLNAFDTNNDPTTKGHMIDATQNPHAVLHDPLWVRSGKHLDNGNPPQTVYDYNQNLANGGIVAAGQNNQNVGRTFTQMAEPNDVGGTYGIQVLFSAVSSF